MPSDASFIIVSGECSSSKSQSDIQANLGPSNQIYVGSGDAFIWLGVRFQGVGIYSICYSRVSSSPVYDFKVGKLTLTRMI